MVKTEQMDSDSRENRSTGVFGGSYGAPSPVPGTLL